MGRQESDHADHGLEGGFWSLSGRNPRQAYLHLGKMGVAAVVGAGVEAEAVAAIKGRVDCGVNQSLKSLPRD